MPFDCAVSSSEATRQIDAHIIFAKDARNAYSKVKAVLLSMYALDQNSKIEQLLNDTKLTSEILPSELLAQMRHLIGESRRNVWGAKCSNFCTRFFSIKQSNF